MLSRNQLNVTLMSIVICALLLLSGYAYGADGTTAAPDVTHSERTIFVIVMENHNWGSIVGNPTAPYINRTLLPMEAHADEYYNPPNLHPSEPNYLWLEAGTNFGVLTDLEPAVNHQSTSLHLTTLLDQAGISWKAYKEGISGKNCPLVSFDHYAPRHNPMVFFDDITDTNNRNSDDCIAHERPYTEFSDDRMHDSIALYNFITPNTCDDMHDQTGYKTDDSVYNGDQWIRSEVPHILASTAYQNGGVLIITWDESEGNERPIGLIVLSPDKRTGYFNKIHYTHSSTLGTIEELFGVTHLLGDAAHATDLRDLFQAGVFQELATPES